MANYSKFFRNGKTFSAYCRMRYGQSKQVWDDTTLWQKRGQYAIALDLKAADAKFGAKCDGPNDFADEEAAEVGDEHGLRQQEEMAAYIHSGAGLRAYYEDQEAGYTL